jgi:hypothetical protein
MASLRTSASFVSASLSAVSRTFSSFRPMGRSKPSINVASTSSSARVASPSFSFAKVFARSAAAALVWASFACRPASRAKRIETTVPTANTTNPAAAAPIGAGCRRAHRAARSRSGSRQAPTASSASHFSTSSAKARALG